MQISVTVTNLDKVDERLSKLGASLHDFTGAMETLGAKLIQFYSNTVFVSGGTALGKRWKALASSTVSEKEKMWPGRGILERTGALSHGFYSDITPTSLYISNKVPYFPYHQLGTSEGRGRGHNIPARPMLGTGARVESMIKTVIEADVRDKINKANV